MARRGYEGERREGAVQDAIDDPLREVEMVDVQIAQSECVFPGAG